MAATRVLPVRPRERWGRAGEVLGIRAETETQTETQAGVVNAGMPWWCGDLTHVLCKQVKNAKGWTDSNANMYERLGLDFNA